MVNIIFHFVFSTLFVGIFLFSVIIGTPARASEDPAIEQQRKLFTKAESLTNKPDSQSFHHLLEKLEDYPLLPYLQQKALMRSLSLKDRDQVEHFLSLYEGTPLDKPLRRKWLRLLVTNNQKDLFLQYYRNVGDQALACKNLEFIMQKAPPEQETLEQISDLWLVGNSQPNACDPIFEQWQKQGMRTPELVLQRLALAAQEGKHTLIPYLKKLLPQEQQYLADLWLQVRRSPSYVSKFSKFPGVNPEQEREILTYGLSRLVWNERELALKSWQVLKTLFSFNPEQTAQIATKFALSLVIIDHEQAEYWLQQASKLSGGDEEILRWHMAHLIRKNQWQNALDVIEFAPPEMSKNNTYQYWRGRAYEQLLAPEMANKTFTELSQLRHYYGFLASGKLAISPSLQNIPLIFSDEEISSVILLPSAQRAHELHNIGRFYMARLEWRYLQQQLTEQQKLISAVIADSWGWHDQAIFTFSNVGYLDDLSRRFPLGFNETLHGQAAKNNIDPAWAFAIVRRESSFMPDANSGAGARGLMQLMPGTARYLSRKKITSRTLYDPQKNVALGTQYMRYLMDKMDNNPVLVTASYNAGWRRVRDWLPENGTLPMDIWVETIPYKETRNYVKAVMAYNQIYSQQLGQANNLFTDLATMQISSLAERN
ncbi:MAG: soluble lytic murein transglycosylase [Paraglaciecola sp.]